MTRRSLTAHDDACRLLGLMTTNAAHVRSHLLSLNEHRAVHPEADLDVNFLIAEAALLRALAGCLDEMRVVRAASALKRARGRRKSDRV